MAAPRAGPATWLCERCGHVPQAQSQTHLVAKYSKWCSANACYARQHLSRAATLLVFLVPKCARKCSRTSHIRQALPKEVEGEATWHRGCSSSSDMHQAIVEVIEEWRHSFGGSKVIDTPTTSATSSWAPFSRIDELWHNWRAGAFGPMTLGEVIKSSADHKDLREAFKLFPDQGAKTLKRNEANPGIHFGVKIVRFMCDLKCDMK